MLPFYIKSFKYIRHSDFTGLFAFNLMNTFDDYTATLKLLKMSWNGNIELYLECDMFIFLAIFIKNMHRYTVI